MGSTLVAVGCLGILGATFLAGFYSGRYWTRSMAVAPEGAAAGGEIAARARGGPAPLRPPPALTFYEELTAPMSPAPSLVKGAPSEPRRPAERAPVTAPRPDDQAARKDKRPGETPARPADPSGGAGSRFTVQIAAYSAKASAEALRATISASGHEAYIVESDSPPGAPRDRVRVGSYPSREAAAAAAARLAVPGGRYVTSR
jgi:cell division septation protein DedD